MVRGGHINEFPSGLRSPPRPERNRQPPLGERRLIVGQCNALVTLFNKTARPGIVGHLYFPAPQPPSAPPCLSKNDNINLAATSLTASIAYAAALVGHEPRQPGTALVYLCAHEELRDAGTVKDLARRPSQQRADLLNLGRATSR